MVVLVNCKQIFAETSRTVVWERGLFWSDYGMRSKEGIVIKVMGDQKSVFFISQSGMEEVIFFFLLLFLWLGIKVFPCVFFFDILNVHFLVSLYFLMTHHSLVWRPGRK